MAHVKKSGKIFYFNHRKRAFETTPVEVNVGSRFFRKTEDDISYQSFQKASRGTESLNGSLKSGR